MSRDDFIKKRGAWDVRHWVRIPSLVDTAQAERISSALENVPGIQRVQTFPGQKKIRVTYDQREVHFHHLLAVLEVTGLPAANNWWSRKKSAWFHYLDQNARINANIPPSPCCSKPTQILSQSKKNSTRRKRKQ